MEQNKSDILTTRFGGVIPIIKEMIKRGMPELIDSSLEAIAPRKHNCKYSFSDMFLSWIAASLCGATRIDNVTGLRKELEVISELNIPSHDSMGRLMKQISQPINSIDRVTQENASLNEWDDNISLNRLLIRATKKMGALKESENYVLDVDCTFIDTRCSGAKSMKDKDAPGFYPMICLIGNLPVFISMRNGNSTADFRIKECIESCLNLLEEEGISISKVRTDGAGYRKELLTTLHTRGVQFVTASPVNAVFKSMLKQFDETNWSSATIETANTFKECQIGEISYKMHGSEIPFRIIALKIPTGSNVTNDFDQEELERREYVSKKMQELKNKGALKAQNKRFSDGFWNEIRGFRYKMIATNDFDTPAEKLIYFYNERGNSERKFDFMKNDFGWKFPPFMRMNENTVFFIITALANNVFRAVAEIFNEHIDELELNARVRRFQKIFIDNTAICTNGLWTYYNTKIDFEKIK